VNISSLVPWFFLIAVLSALLPFVQLFADERGGTLPARPFLRFFRRWIITAAVCSIAVLLHEAYLRGLLF
jgi:hypothetical protein